MKIVNWQSHFTDHQYFTWKELQKLMDEEIIHVVAKITSEIRKNQGWTSLDLTGLDVINFSDKNWWGQGTGIIKQHPDYIHVFGGFWANKKYFLLMLYAVFQGCKVVVMDEPYATKSVGYFHDSNRGVNFIKVLMRPWLYSGVSKFLRLISNVKNFSILAISVRAEEQFLKAGFAKEQVFPFGYFVPRQGGIVQQSGQCEGVKLIFVGALLKRKGADLAVAAVESLCDEGIDVHLDIYGAGEPELLISHAFSCVSYKGTIPFGNAQAVIAKYDALVLPSRHDGWGVVVNEALLQGVPVIISDHVGAKCLVELSNSAGLVFRCEDVADLTSKIRHFSLDSKLRSDMRKFAGEVGSRILPENAASYMHAVLNFYYYDRGTRPDLLWVE